MITKEVPISEVFLRDEDQYDAKAIVERARNFHQTDPIYVEYYNQLPYKYIVVAGGPDYVTLKYLGHKTIFITIEEGDKMDEACELAGQRLGEAYRSLNGDGKRENSPALIAMLLDLVINLIKGCINPTPKQLTKMCKEGGILTRFRIRREMQKMGEISRRDRELVVNAVLKAGADAQEEELNGLMTAANEID